MNEEIIIHNLLNNFRLMLPEIALVVTACVVFLGGTFVGRRDLWAGVSLIGVLVGLLLFPYANTPDDLRTNVFVSALVGDPLAHFVRYLALGGGVVLILLSWKEIGDRQAGDYFGCLLIVIAGLSLVGAANELVTMFLALELISIPTYVMLYLPKHDNASQEAAMKYFMLSVFSSAILLFGFSYLYGLTGSTNISVLMVTLNGLSSVNEVPVLAQVAVIMIVAGLGFKIAAVPFHFYAPDVYQGTSTVMAAVLAFVPKVAGFVAMMRVFGFVVPPELPRGNFPIGTALSNQIPILLWFLAAVTMFLGNILALLQDNLKRLFAYSSIAHAGYMLIALAAAPYLRRAAALQGDIAGPDGIEAVLYYLVAYGVMTVGAFSVIAYLHSPERPVETVDDMAGLSRTHPWIAVLLTIFLFSLIGIPFTAGFNGKFLIFLGAIGVSDPDPERYRIIVLFRVLAVLGVINAAIGAWYYLKIIAAMFLRTAIKPVTRPGSIPGFATIVICAVLTIGLSIPPGATWLLKAVHQASGSPAASNVQTAASD